MSGETYSQSNEIFGLGGKLSLCIKNYSPRQSQIDMAEAVEQCIADADTLIVEAGTGTGKTFAYLVPALLTGEKIIISTGTKNLQDQLFHKDLPLIQKALGKPIKASLLKGRGNYICRYRVEKFQHSGTYLERRTIQDLHEVNQWMNKTQQGDRAELTTIDEDSPVWPYVTSTADNCLQHECPFVNNCFVNNARKSAQEADLIVVNHHLFFADLGLKETGFAELLPSSNLVIFDEAHQIPEIAQIHFSKRFSTRQITELVQDLKQELKTTSTQLATLEGTADRLEITCYQLRASISLPDGRFAWHDLEHETQFHEALTALTIELSAVAEQLTQVATSDKAILALAERATDLLIQFKQLNEETNPNEIHWLEVYQKAIVFYHTPIYIGDAIQELLSNESQAWIFTSATLAVNNNFDHFKKDMGIIQAQELILDSPFNYKTQSLLYLPRGLPDIKQTTFFDAFIDKSVELLELSQGRAFILFTSYRNLRRASEIIPSKTDFPILIQGQKPKAKLLSDFERLDNSVLLGTQSFWEGVDVRGDALSCVIIEKLPFQVPDDPLLKARERYLREQGINSFASYQIPKAAINLKQGVGRLIRDINDRGIVMIADPRLGTRDYGKQFLQSLPPMPITREVRLVKQFFEHHFNKHSDETLITQV